MPFADPEKNRAATRKWMQCNPLRVKAAKERWKAKRRLLYPPSRKLVRLMPSRTPEQKSYFRKLRRIGVNLTEARKAAYG